MFCFTHKKLLSHVHNNSYLKSALTRGRMVEAMSPESSLLIDDWVLPKVGTPVAGGTYDLMMLMLLSGMD